LCVSYEQGAPVGLCCLGLWCVWGGTHVIFNGGGHRDNVAPAVPNPLTTAPHNSLQGTRFKRTRKVDVRLPGKGNSNRPTQQTSGSTSEPELGPVRQFTLKKSRPPPDIRASSLPGVSRFTERHESVALQRDRSLVAQQGSLVSGLLCGGEYPCCLRW